MIDITAWTNNFLQTLNKTFGDRVWFVGLQGSYGRGEATEQTYHTMLNTLPHRELICGFLSGKDENLIGECLK